MATPSHQPGTTIAGALTGLAQNHPGRMALAVACQRGGRRYEEVSFAELERDANVYAQAFAHHGIGKGTRTVMMVTPGREFCAAIFGLLKLGAAPVFIDPGIGLRHVGPCIRQAMPEAFVGIRKAQTARRVFGWGRDTIRISLTMGSSPDRLLKNTEPRMAVPPAPGDDGIAAIAFTSGSTGPPKGVVFDHENLRAQAERVEELLGPYAREPHLTTFPLLLLFAPVLGCSAIVPDMDTSKPAKADPARILAASADYGCQSMFASPVLVRKLGAYCLDTGRRLYSMERVLSAGAPSDPDVLATLARALAPGGEIFTPYGATEALPVSNLSSREILAETRDKTRRGAGVCVGRPVHGVTAHIIPISDGALSDWSHVSPLPPGEMGEITVSGGVVSPRYFANHEATLLAKIPCRATNTLYHRMGDLGYFDESGRLWMCGRKSHRVVTSRRVYFTVPAEGVFNSHQAVARTALVGIPGPETNVPVLCVELAARRSGQAKRTLTAELRALGAQYEHTRDIRHFLYHPSFPVDTRHNSKIRREDLSIWASRRIRARDLEAKERQP